ncbi:hypothetical protein BCR34DRAFT_434319, partial [Clohesyomyces aquaticus]
IVGLVLGAFPISLHALDSYRQGADVLKDWWRIQRAHKRCKQDLSYHRILFEENVERFLLLLVVDEDELKTLIDDPAGEAWEAQDLEQKLKARLPKSYGIFLEIIRAKKELVVQNIVCDSEARMVSLSHPQNLLQSNNITERHSAHVNIDFQMQCIRFSLKKSSRERTFERFQELNDRLRSLHESGDQVASARRSRETAKSPSGFNKKLHDFWRHAKRLHEALSKSWQCRCTTHIVNLQLQHRPSDVAEFEVL